MKPKRSKDISIRDQTIPHPQPMKSSIKDKSGVAVPTYLSKDIIELKLPPIAQGQE